MDSIMTKIDAYVEQNRQRFIEELQAFLRQPSISTENIGMEECVDMIKVQLDKLDLAPEVLTLEGAFPAVYGTSGPPEEGKKQLLVYGHYDVQSPDPVDKWTSDPFSAEIRDGHIYARGATDDKGNLYANIKAAETLKTVMGDLPKGFKFIFEGEEEVGSPNLSRYLKEYTDILKADVCVLCDRGVHESGRPQMYLGNKGLFTVEIGAKRAKRDVHSGHAPLIHNAIWDLVRLVNSMKNELEEITIDGYYDSLRPIPDEELELLKSIPYDLDQFKKEYAIDEIIGNGDVMATLKRLLYTPTCNISGIKGGWCGERSKTIVPCEAWLRLDMRLVKNMTVADARKKVLDFIAKSPFGKFEVRSVGENEPYQISPKHEMVQIAIHTAEEVYGEPPVVWPLLDGSGPMCMFPQYLGAENFIIGLGAPFSTANTHAPDENISIEQYITGIKYMANVYYRYLMEE